MCIFWFCPVLHLSSPSVITAPCRVHPCSFVCMNVCSPLYYYTLMLAVCILLTEKRDDQFCVCQADISAHVVVHKSFFEVQIHLTFPMYFKGVVPLVHSKQNACQPLNGNYKQPGFVWLLSMFDKCSELHTRGVCVSALLKKPVPLIPFTLFSLQRFLPQMIYGEYCCLGFSQAWIL